MGAGLSSSSSSSSVSKSKAKGKGKRTVKDELLEFFPRDLASVVLEFIGFYIEHARDHQKRGSTGWTHVASDGTRVLAVRDNLHLYDWHGTDGWSRNIEHLYGQDAESPLHMLNLIALTEESVYLARRKSSFGTAVSPPSLFRFPCQYDTIHEHWGAVLHLSAWRSNVLIVWRGWPPVIWFTVSNPGAPSQAKKSFKLEDVFDVVCTAMDDEHVFTVCFRYTLGWRCQAFSKTLRSDGFEANAFMVADVPCGMYAKVAACPSLQAFLLLDDKLLRVHRTLDGLCLGHIPLLEPMKCFTCVGKRLYCITSGPSGPQGQGQGQEGGQRIELDLICF